VSSMFPDVYVCGGNIDLTFHIAIIILFLFFHSIHPSEADWFLNNLVFMV
jgi:hypothetical protein